MTKTAPAHMPGLFLFIYRKETKRVLNPLTVMLYHRFILPRQQYSQRS
jgi:hypothetical protein